jgi:hypothetical protein
MKSPAEKILDSIVEEFATSGMNRPELEARAIFRILNYCPPLEVDVPLVEKPALFT